MEGVPAIHQVRVPHDKLSPVCLLTCLLRFECQAEVVVEESSDRLIAVDSLLYDSDPLDQLGFWELVLDLAEDLSEVFLD